MILSSLRPLRETGLPYSHAKNATAVTTNSPSKIKDKAVFPIRIRRLTALGIVGAPMAASILDLP
jgi:hypothetical protein